MEIIDFVKDYAAVINTALLVSFLTILFKLFNTYKVAKEAEISVIKAQNENNRIFSADNVTKQMNSLKEWHNESMRQLELEKEKAIKSKEKEFQETIESEINLRNKLKEKLKNKPKELFNGKEVPIENFIGEFSVTGRNPGDTLGSLSYYGNLKILIINDEIIVTWTIESKQTFMGIGVFYGNQLSVYFTEAKPTSDFNGVISYKILSNDIIRGKWTGLGSGGKYGFEECRRIK